MLSLEHCSGWFSCLCANSHSTSHLLAPTRLWNDGIYGVLSGTFCVHVRKGICLGVFGCRMIGDDELKP